MAAKRLTRKEIVQQDPIRRTLTETSHWAVENIHLLLGGFVILVIVALGGFLWQSYSESQNEELQVAFSEALEIFHTPVTPPATEEPLSQEPSEEGATPAEEDATEQEEPVETPVESSEEQTEAQAFQPKFQFETEEQKYERALQEFSTIADDYSGYRLGETAAYYSALAKMELGRTDEAKAELDALIAESDYGDVRNLARTTRSQLAASEGDSERVIQLLQQALEENSSNFPNQFLRYRIAETYESQGKLQEALEAYRRITTEHAGTQEARMAQTKVSELELKVGPDDQGASASSESSTEVSPDGPQQPE